MISENRYLTPGKLAINQLVLNRITWSRYSSRAK
jgi:hypothetical protein